MSSAAFCAAESAAIDKKIMVMCFSFQKILLFQINYLSLRQNLLRKQNRNKVIDLENMVIEKFRFVIVEITLKTDCKMYIS